MSRLNIVVVAVEKELSDYEEALEACKKSVGPIKLVTAFRAVDAVSKLGAVVQAGRCHGVFMSHHFTAKGKEEYADVLKKTLKDKYPEVPVVCMGNTKKGGDQGKDYHYPLEWKAADGPAPVAKVLNMIKSGEITAAWTSKKGRKSVEEPRKSLDVQPSTGSTIQRRNSMEGAPAATPKAAEPPKLSRKSLETASDAKAGPAAVAAKARMAGVASAASPRQSMDIRGAASPRASMDLMRGGMGAGSAGSFGGMVPMSAMLPNTSLTPMTPMSPMAPMTPMSMMSPITPMAPMPSPIGMHPMAGMASMPSPIGMHPMAGMTPMMPMGGNPGMVPMLPMGGMGAMHGSMMPPMGAVPAPAPAPAPESSNANLIRTLAEEVTRLRLLVEEKRAREAAAQPAMPMPTTMHPLAEPMVTGGGLSMGVVGLESSGSVRMGSVGY